MKRAFVFLPVVLTLAVSACEWNRNVPPLGKDYGNAVSHNMSQHIVNPEPVGAGYGVGLNAEDSMWVCEQLSQKGMAAIELSGGTLEVAEMMEMPSPA